MKQIDRLIVRVVVIDYFRRCFEKIRLVSLSSGSMLLVAGVCSELTQCIGPQVVHKHQVVMLEVVLPNFLQILLLLPDC